MKAITLWQPWASLIAYGVKTRETRSWEPPRGLIGQRIAIHAAARPMRHADMAPSRIEPIPREAFPLPLGAIVATAKIARVDQADGTHLDPYGDYTAGRFVWTLEDVRRLRRPIPARGFQGFWKWP